MTRPGRQGCGQPIDEQKQPISANSKERWESECFDMVSCHRAKDDFSSFHFVIKIFSITQFSAADPMTKLNKEQSPRPLKGINAFAKIIS